MMTIKLSDYNRSILILHHILDFSLKKVRFEPFFVNGRQYPFESGREIKKCPLSYGSRIMYGPSKLGANPEAFDLFCTWPAAFRTKSPTLTTRGFKYALLIFL